MTPASVQALGELLRLAEIRRTQFGFGPWEDAWCRSSISGAVARSALNPSELSDLADLGCRVDVEVEIDRFRLTAIAQSSRQFVIEANAEWVDAAIDDASVLTGPLAAASNDLIATLAHIRDVQVKVTVTVLHDGDDLLWVRIARAFVEEYSRSGWLGFSQLVAGVAPATLHVVVFDAGAAVIHAAGVLVHGPEIWPQAETWTDSGAELARPKTDDRTNAPSPEAVMPIGSGNTTTAAVRDVLCSMAGALAWLWLADSVMVNGLDVAIRFEGTRLISGELPACPPHLADASVKLWHWVAVGNQPGRRFAMVQAVTLQAETPSDLYERADSLLGFAQFLFSIAQSQLVQEALAARRAAREAAVAAARSAVDRASSAAQSAIDRTLAVIAAGVGVVLANAGNLIDRSVAFALLGLAATLTIGAALLAFQFELPGATKTIDVFEEELPMSAEVLAPRDVDEIKRLPSIRDARVEITRARHTTWIIVAVAIAALAVLATVLGEQASPVPAKKTPTSTTLAPRTMTKPSPLRLSFPGLPG